MEREGPGARVYDAPAMPSLTLSGVGVLKAGFDQFSSSTCGFKQVRTLKDPPRLVLLLLLLFSCCHVGLFTTPSTAACQASLSFTFYRSLLKLVSSHLILCHLLLLLSLIFSQCQGLFQRLGSLHQMAKVLELQLQHQSLSSSQFIKI